MRNVTTDVQFTMHLDAFEKMPVILTIRKGNNPKRTEKMEVKFTENIIFLYREGYAPKKIVLLEPPPEKESLFFQIARWMKNKLQQNDELLGRLNDHKLQVNQTFHSEFVEEPAYMKKLLKTG